MSTQTCQFLLALKLNKAQDHLKYISPYPSVATPSNLNPSNLTPTNYLEIFLANPPSPSVNFTRILSKVGLWFRTRKYTEKMNPTTWKIMRNCCPRLRSRVSSKWRK